MSSDEFNLHYIKEDYMKRLMCNGKLQFEPNVPLTVTYGALVLTGVYNYDAGGCWKKIVFLRKVIEKKSPGLMIQPGTYKYKFQFGIPKNTPPTFRDDICNIKYKVTVRLNYIEKGEKKVYTRYMRFIVEPNIVVPPILYDKKLCRIDNRVRIKGGDISLSKIRVEIPTAIGPKDNVCLLFLITPITQKVLKTITVSLLEETKYEFSPLRKSREITKCIANVAVIKEGVEKYPVYMPFGMIYSVSTISHTTYITRDYVLNIVAKFGPPDLDVSVKVPIIVAKRETEDENPSKIQITRLN